MTVSSTQCPPILFLVFNRPHTTRHVFEAIRRASPSRLYIAADGPRASHPDDIRRCADVIHIVTGVDWPCDVKTLFREHNLGCKHAVSSAITWFFENEEAGIILEDDCLPHPDFFVFCETLLKKYQNDERVFVVTGNNFQHGRRRGNASYYFSRYNHCWGWASWSRAWRYYQGSIPFWPDWRSSSDWAAFMPDKIERRYWSRIFNQVAHGDIDSWAYPWTASVWAQHGLTATPNVNLVTNIGFGSDATHTTSANDPNARIPVAPLGPITHPSDVLRNAEADRYAFDHAFGGKYMRFPDLIYHKPKRLVSRISRKISYELNHLR